MRTLFLNPNSSESITETLKRQISAHGLDPASYEVRQLEGAPKIIGSAMDNALSVSLLKAQFKTLTSGFERLVMMSSLDTGFEAACSLGGIEVHGFTRSVLAQYRCLERQLQIITFDASMTSLYRALFKAKEHEGVVQSITVLPLAPADVMGGRKAVLESLRKICRKLAESSPASIFIVGAVGLELGEVLRQEGLVRVTDPIADLVTHLKSKESIHGDRVAPR